MPRSDVIAFLKTSACGGYGHDAAHRALDQFPGLSWDELAAAADTAAHQLMEQQRSPDDEWIAVVLGEAASYARSMSRGAA